MTMEAVTAGFSVVPIPVAEIEGEVNNWLVGTATLDMKAAGEPAVVAEAGLLAKDVMLAKEFSVESFATVIVVEGVREPCIPLVMMMRFDVSVVVSNIVLDGCGEWVVATADKAIVGPTLPRIGVLSPVIAVLELSAVAIEPVDVWSVAAEGVEMMPSGIENVEVTDGLLTVDSCAVSCPLLMVVTLSVTADVSRVTKLLAAVCILVLPCDATVLFEME